MRLRQVASVLFILFFAAPSWAQPLPVAPPETVGFSVERLNRLGKVLKEDVEKNKLPGAVVAIARKGKLAYFEAVGFQDKPSGKAMDKDAIFRVYSMTKPWTSVAAIILMEEGRLQLTDPVSKYLPAFKDLKVATRNASGADVLEPANREPTVQDLLRHTSGLGYDFLTKNAAVRDAYKAAGLEAIRPGIRDSLSPAEFTERLAKAPLASQPGTFFEYSLSTALLGRVIEAASGMRLSQFLEEKLFKPLKMTSSGFSIPKDRAGRIANPILPYEVIELFDPTVPPANDLGGEGGLSTAADYIRFLEMLRLGGQIEGTRILSPASITLMTSDHLSPNGTRIPGSPVGPGEVLLGTQGYTFGLGFMVRLGDGNAAVPGAAGEYLWGGAAGTFFWVDPKTELAAVFMAQVPFSARASYRRLMKQLVYAAIVN
jgi:CubicO group peptidase (beta-lactamase class C family)